MSENRGEQADKDLIVMILVPTHQNGHGPEDGKVGTGCAVGKDLILTSRHVAQPKNRNKDHPILVRWYGLRDSDPDSGWWKLDPDDNKAICWVGKGNIDAALLACPRPQKLRDRGSYRIALDRPGDNREWGSRGFPIVHGESEATEILGKTTSSGKSDDFFSVTTELQIGIQQTDWSGASGMPVLIGDVVYGIVTSVPKRYDNRELKAVPASLLRTDEGFCEAMGPELDFDEILLETRLVQLAERFKEPLPIRILIAASTPTAMNVDMENEAAVIKQILLGLLIRSRLREYFEVDAFRLIGDGRAQRILGTHSNAPSDPGPLPFVDTFDWVLFLLWHNLGPENALSSLFEQVRQVDVSLRRDESKRILVFYKKNAMPRGDTSVDREVRQQWDEDWEETRTFYDTFSAQFPTQFEVYEGQRFEDHFERAIRDRLGYLIKQHAHDKGLRPAGEAARGSDQPEMPVNPYKGLEAYARDDGVRFFGRVDEVDDLRDRIADPDRGLVAVVGASGSGKSSLVRAGLFHRLALGAIAGSADWMVFETRVKGKYDILTDALAHDVYEQWPTVGKRPQCVEHYKDVGSYLKEEGKLSELVGRLLEDCPQASRVLLFVDQFEELFTLIPDDEEAQRREYIDLLVRAAATPRLQVILAMRSDFYHRCIVYPQLRELFKTGVYPLTTPSVDALQSIIVRPALYNGFSFEDAGLPRRILQDAGVSSGALPLVSYTLAQLVDKALAAGRTELTHQDYEGLGLVAGIIQRQADEAVANLRKDEGFEERFNAVFRNLVTVDDKGTATKRPATLASIPESAQPIVKRLVDARLLQSSKQEEKQQVDPSLLESLPTAAEVEPIVEIVHEALLVHWQQLKTWIDETQDALLTRRRVETAAREWQQARAKDDAWDEKSNLEAPAVSLQQLERDRKHLWEHERLQEVYAALEKLGLEQATLEPAVRAFIRPEFHRLLDELKVEGVDHRRHAEIGNRLDDLRDQRPGVGVFIESEINNEIERLEREDRFGFEIDHQRLQQLRSILEQKDTNQVRSWHGLPDIAWCAVPAGEVEMRLETDGEGKPNDTVVTRRIEKPFWIAKYPLTIAQLFTFGCPWDESARAFDKNRRTEQYFDPRWWLGFPKDSRDGMTVNDRGKTRRKDFSRPADSPIQEQDAQANFPAQFINWFQAVAYARWLTQRYRELGLMGEPDVIRLPTEWEWQQAATGGHNEFFYPWGRDWNSAYCRNLEGQNSPSSVGLYPLGASPTGACDMSGLIVEWCLNTYDDIEDINETTDRLRPTRGGAYFTFARPDLPQYKPKYSNCVHGRLSDHPSGMNDDHRLIRTGVRFVCTGMLPDAKKLVTWEQRLPT